MDTSKIIKGVVNSGRYTVTAPIVKEDYGLYLQIGGVELPQTYEVDFSNSEHNGTSVTMIGNADGVLIPHQFIDTGKDIFAFLYHVGANYGRTVYKFRIPNKIRPDRTEEQPTPEEQSAIDQAISALNEAVAQTAQDVIDADASAQNASADADRAESARDTAQGYANNAQTSANNASASAQASANSATASAQSASASAQIKSDVEDLVDDAQGYAQASERSASASANSASQASGYAQSASASAQSASGYASQAQTSAQTASSKASEASTSANTASTKASESAQSASHALSYKTDAESAKTASQTAQGLAESARDSAVSAKEDAESARDEAVTAKNAVQASADQIAQNAEDVSDLKEGLSSVANVKQELAVYAEKQSGSDVLPEGFTTGKGYIRNMTVSNPGSISTSENSRWFAFYLSEDADIYVPLDKSGVGTYRNICVYTSDGPNTNNRVTPVYRSNSTDYPLPTESTPLHVLAGQCVAFSYNNVSVPLEVFSFTVYHLVNSGLVLNDSLPLTAEMDSEVDAKIDGEIANIRDVLDDGYYHLPTDKFARHGWNNSTTADNRNYRVRYTEPLTFDTTVYGVLKEGYTIAGFEDGTFFDSRSVKTFFPNAEYKIYVRRFTEDSSEIADINEFANALKLSTGIAPIELYSPTFADVSMFERVGVCGDSYAAGGGIISGVRPLTWGKNLERQAGITVDIYAKSGQNVMQWNVDATNGLPALLNGAECGLYWMQHGINGTSTAEQFGTLEDITTYPHPNTFCGQYTEAVEQIKTAFPNARIILATIIGSGFSLYQSQYSAVNNAIKAIATHCGVMLVDVADDDFYRSPYYLTWIRSNHPTAMQCAGIAMANRRLISKCIQENGDYFVNYGAD